MNWTMRPSPIQQAIRRGLPRLRPAASLPPRPRRLCSLPDPDAAIGHNLKTEDMPRTLQRRVAALDTLQNQVEALEMEHERRLRELERQFHEESAGIFDRRRAIVVGAAEPTEEEVKSSSIAPVEDGPPNPLDATCPPGIPGFWMTAMMQCDEIHDPDTPVFNDDDWLVLATLEDVRTEPWLPPAMSWEDLLGEEDSELHDQETAAAVEDETDQAMGFALHFRFAEDSPFLATREISVYCHGHGQVVETVPEAIEWREGMDPTVQRKTNKKRNKRTGEVDSFFNLFVSLRGSFDDALGDIEAGRDDFDLPLPEELMDGLAEKQERALLAIRESLVPHATAYYIQALVDEGEEGEGSAPQRQLEEILKHNQALAEGQRATSPRGKRAH